MKCLQVNGCAVIKIYTLFSQEMLNFMNQFCPMFERVYLHKPAASKPGNSEVGSFFVTTHLISFLGLFDWNWISRGGSG